MGLRSERLGDAAPWRRTVVVANVLAILFTLPALGALQRHESEFVSYPAGPAPSAGIAAVDSNGNMTEATNLFAFGPDGQPIDHVRLYDQDGHPVVVGDVDQSECWAGTTPSPLPTASPSNVFPLPQLTPQLDADGNPTGTCVASSSAPAFVVPPLVGYTPSPTPSASASVPAKPSSAASHSSASPSAKATKAKR